MLWSMDAWPQIDDLRMLCAVVRCGSYRAAAAHLGTTQPRVTRAVQRLEARLDRALIRRSPRSVAPTALGRRYTTEIERLLAGLAEVESELIDNAGEMSGSLLLSVPPAVGRRLLLPALSSFTAAHPAIRLHLSLGATRVDLIAGEVDLAIRFGPLADTWRRARRVLRGAYHIYGEPELIRSLRSFGLEEALARAPCLVLHANHLRDRWPIRKGRGLRWLPVRPALLCNDADALIRFTVLGRGLTIVPDFLVAQEIRDGTLEPLTTPTQAAPADVYAVMDAASPPARVTKLVDHLVAHLREDRR